MTKTEVMNNRWKLYKEKGIGKIGKAGTRKFPFENFKNKIFITKNGCWEWQGKINKVTGYGQFAIYQGYVIGKYKHYLAHRFAYEYFKGVIPFNLTIDHICKNRKCVNPNHLRLLSLIDNILAGNGITAINKRKIYCIRGHEFQGNNLYITPDGRRQCKKCRKDSVKKYCDK